MSYIINTLDLYLSVMNEYIKVLSFNYFDSLIELSAYVIKDKIMLTLIDISLIGKIN